MILCFDTTSDSGQVHVKEINKNGKLKKEKKYSTDLIRALEKFTKDFSKIKVFCPLVGKGRFTATRTAVTVANALAFASDARAVAIPHDIWDNNDSIFKFVKNSKKQLASAQYSAKPSIGKSHA
jgi:tRNA A37 threonylcarbamoyladenosine modification protein TsaB